MRILSKTVFNTNFVIGCDGDLYSIKIYHCGRSLFIIGYHWLPLATIDLVSDNREFEV